MLQAAQGEESSNTLAQAEGSSLATMNHRHATPLSGVPVVGLGVEGGLGQRRGDPHLPQRLVEQRHEAVSVHGPAAGLTAGVGLEPGPGWGNPGPASY